MAAQRMSTLMGRLPSGANKIHAEKLEALHKELAGMKEESENVSITHVDALH